MTLLTNVQKVISVLFYSQWNDRLVPTTYLLLVHFVLDIIPSVNYLPQLNKINKIMLQNIFVHRLCAYCGQAKKSSTVCKDPKKPQQNSEREIVHQLHSFSYTNFKSECICARTGT